MELEVVVCSTSGKPVFQYDRRSGSAASGEADADDAATRSSFVSSLQGLLSFVSCMQHEELRELQSAGCRCVFQSADNLTLAAIVRSSGSCTADAPPDMAPECLRRLLQLLHAQILFVLSDRGLDVLRKQPGYDLRELLSGTERIMCALTDSWATTPALRFQHLGVPFLRLAPDKRREIARALEYEAASTAEKGSAMICGLLLAGESVVAVAQPNKKQFSVLVDDLLLLINFVYHTPSLAKSETWTPICLPSFNASGFLYAYVVFLANDVCLLLLSSEQSPEQFPRFQAKKAYVAQQLEELGTMEAILTSIQSRGNWRPHGDLPLLHHFVYKNELTSECAAPELASPFDDADFDTRLLLMNQYAKLHHLMFPTSGEPATRESQVLGKRLATLKDTTAARMVYERSDTGLFLGLCNSDFRLYAWFDSLANVPEAREQTQVLLDRLRYDDQLMSAALFLSGGTFPSVSSLTMWP